MKRLIKGIFSIFAAAVVSAAAAVVSAAAAVVSAAAAQAAPPEAVAAAERMLPDDAEIASIEEAAPGIYEVVSDGQIFYVTADGKFLINGSIWNVETKESLTENSQKRLRAAALNEVGDDEMVIYRPKNRKYTVAVFTDVNCGYCRKFHAHIPELMRLGIQVNYLLTPLQGKDARAKAVAVWCASDRNAAMDRAKQGKDIPLKQCDNPVDKHLRVSRRVGMRGTPAIVLESGAMIGGYVPPKELLRALKEDAQTSRS